LINECIHDSLPYCISSISLIWLHKWFSTSSWFTG
jgi:hypothetical protein